MNQGGHISCFVFGFRQPSPVGWPAEYSPWISGVTVSGQLLHNKLNKDQNISQQVCPGQLHSDHTWEDQSAALMKAKPLYLRPEDHSGAQ